MRRVRDRWSAIPGRAYSWIRPSHDFKAGLAVQHAWALAPALPVRERPRRIAPVYPEATLRSHREHRFRALPARWHRRRVLGALAAVQFPRRQLCRRGEGVFAAGPVHIRAFGRQVRPDAELGLLRQVPAGGVGEMDWAPDRHLRRSWPSAPPVADQESRAGQGLDGRRHLGARQGDEIRLREARPLAPDCVHPQPRLQRAWWPRRGRAPRQGACGGLLEFGDRRRLSQEWHSQRQHRAYGGLEAFAGAAGVAHRVQSPAAADRAGALPLRQPRLSDDAVGLRLGWRHGGLGHPHREGVRYQPPSHQPRQRGRERGLPA
mmetsp:Transcript_32436/g.89707  ORF Transcript_32436/g.89707 Transcript_32436/m.89707 type:complete len:319 (-) Transcript_32436:945-1901(-)